MKIFNDKELVIVAENVSSNLLKCVEEKEIKPRWSGHTSYAFSNILSVSLVLTGGLFEEKEKFLLYDYNWSGVAAATAYEEDLPGVFFRYLINKKEVSREEFQEAVFKKYGFPQEGWRNLGNIVFPASLNKKSLIAKKLYKQATSEIRSSRREKLEPLLKRKELLLLQINKEKKKNKKRHIRKRAAAIDEEIKEVKEMYDTELEMFTQKANDNAIFA